MLTIEKELQQQKNMLLSSPISLEQESEITVDKNLLKLDRHRLENKTRKGFTFYV